MDATCHWLPTVHEFISRRMFDSGSLQYATQDVNLNLHLQYPLSWPETSLIIQSYSKCNSFVVVIAGVDVVPAR